MSSILGLPYVAPWQASFERFSTQLIPLDVQSAFTNRKQVPSGQFWRPIYFSFRYDTSGVPGNRTMELAVLTDSGQVATTIRTPAPQTAGLNVFYLFAPGVSAYSNLAAANAGYMTIPYPDVLWQEGSIFQVQSFNADAGDTLNTVTMATELYIVAEPVGSMAPSAPILLT